MKYVSRINKKISAMLMVFLSWAFAGDDYKVGAINFYGTEPPPRSPDINFTWSEISMNFIILILLITLAFIFGLKIIFNNYRNNAKKNIKTRKTETLDDI